MTYVNDSCSLAPECAQLFTLKTKSGKTRYYLTTVGQLCRVPDAEIVCVLVFNFSDIQATRECEVVEVELQKHGLLHSGL